MKKAGLTCDAEEVFANFCHLAKTEMTSAMKSAVRAGASAIRKQTISNAKTGVKSTHNHPNDPYQGDEIWDAVRLGRLRDEDGEDISMKVHIYGSKKDDSQTYRFRFLENGTRDRYAKTYNGKPLTKPRYLGRISPRNWFKSAQDSVFPQMERIFLERIEKCINKVNNS